MQPWRSCMLPRYGRRRCIWHSQLQVSFVEELRSPLSRCSENMGKERAIAVIVIKPLEYKILKQPTEARMTVVCNHPDLKSSL